MAWEADAGEPEGTGFFPPFALAQLSQMAGTRTTATKPTESRTREESHPVNPPASLPSGPARSRSKWQLPELHAPATLPSMITVESDDREIRVTIPRGDLEIAQVEAILRPFRFASLIAGSKMSKAEAMQISEESKADWWEKNEKRFVPPEL